MQQLPLTNQKITYQNSIRPPPPQANGSKARNEYQANTCGDSRHANANRTICLMASHMPTSWTHKLDHHSYQSASVNIRCPDMHLSQGETSQS